MWYRALRPALFALDPERAHALVLEGLRAVGHRGLRSRDATPVLCMGLTFANRVGLAAGFDKNAVAIDGLGRLGFGFIEVGTVTPRPQAGQPRPRLFRIPAAGALVNRLGFPNEGADVVAARLRRRRYAGIVGVNLGKNADTPLARAVDDYVSGLRTFRTLCDYIAINVSSPNTMGLRDLQGATYLEPLLIALLEERARGAAQDGHRPPLLLKISPDLAADDLEAVAGLLRTLALDGVIATNTTIDRRGERAVGGTETGGLSGRPLHAVALRTVGQLRALLGPRFPIVGVGGVDSPEAALAMRAAGADLVQLYTGMVYRGPSLVTRCARALTT